ncbi:hypothetical protein [uncultured Gemmiger sp.]|uniref:hypothetical protein n=1 Tax=uncultured Gemmiger sp. TaxID=1623490 RepID=UPI0025CC0AF5|nr:hypothetical protein [uncultured Gemmiger sp.]
MKRLRLIGLLAAMMLLAAFSLPVAAEDYDTVMDGLSRLYSLAGQYAQDNSGQSLDPIELTLSYTRTGVYNSGIWQVTAGVRDAGFESYVAEQDGDLVSLQGLGSVETSAGSVDFGHLLASLNLVYRGLPVAGSWGGDCMELARQYAGQASDAAGYADLMSGTFEDDNSVFGGDDLRADLDAVVIGSRLSQGADLAQTIRDYYSSANEYDRAYQFIALTFGDVNTGDVSTFGDEIYQAATQDTGMQLLLYLNQMWVSDGWTIAEDSAVPLQGACRVFAQYLSGAVNGDRVKSDADTRMVTMAGDMLAEFLSAMGDGDAASAALSANDGSETSTTSSGSSVSEIFSGAAQGIQSGFSLQVFETVLLVIGAAALMLLLICIVMLVRRR